MRIVHFLWGLAQGGSESLAVDLANDQSTEHDVHILVVNDNVDQFLAQRIGPKVQLTRIGRPEGSRNPFWIAKLIWTISSIRPDVIHSHCDKIAALQRYIAAPLVMTVHSNGMALTPKSTGFAAICCISKAVQFDIDKRYPKLRTTLVPNGINTNSISYKAPREPSLPIRAVQVSRLAHETKGQDLLIEAVATINEGMIEPIIAVDFIGTGASLTLLSEMAQSRHVSHLCRFLGSKSREAVFETLQNYDVLIQPSRDEGFGLTVAEGMAAGIAVVVSNLPGPVEVLGDGKLGYVFESNSVESLVNTLRKFVNERHLTEMGDRLRAARQHVVAHYDLSITSKSYIQIYQSAVQKA